MDLLVLGRLLGSKYRPRDSFLTLRHALKYSKSSVSSFFVLLSTGVFRQTQIRLEKEIHRQQTNPAETRDVV